MTFVFVVVDVLVVFVVLVVWEPWFGVGLMSGFLTAGVAHETAPMASIATENSISSKEDNLCFITLRVVYSVFVLFYSENSLSTLPLTSYNVPSYTSLSLNVPVK